jgi:anti-sigma factor RsiW
MPDLESRLASALGAPMHIPDLADAKLDFREGRELEYRGKTIVQLVYLPKADGKPVALCAIKKPVKDFPPRFLPDYPLGIVQWASGGVEYLLVGDQPRGALELAAYKAQKRL